MPIRRNPANRSAQLGAATTRPHGVGHTAPRHPQHTATTLSVASQTSLAVVSSNAVVTATRAAPRAPVATTTPCLGHATRRVVVCKNTCVVPRS